MVNQICCSSGFCQSVDKLIGESWARVSITANTIETACRSHAGYDQYDYVARRLHIDGGLHQVQRLLHTNSTTWPLPNPAIQHHLRFEWCGTRQQAVRSLRRSRVGWPGHVLDNQVTCWVTRSGVGWPGQVFGPHPVLSSIRCVDSRDAACIPHVWVGGASVSGRGLSQWGVGVYLVAEASVSGGGGLVSGRALSQWEGPQSVGGASVSGRALSQWEGPQSVGGASVSGRALSQWEGPQSVGGPSVSGRGLSQWESPTLSQWVGGGSVSWGALTNAKRC